MTYTPFTVGIDEAGRGALAGPVVAAACILPTGSIPVRIDDSKAMTPEEREESFEWLIKNCIHGIGSVEATEIDADGIMAATEKAMQEAVKAISMEHPDLYLLVDGRDKFWFDHPHSSVIGGDALEPCIGAASIIAKVTRDRRMIREHERFPDYGFAIHKGYGTPEHMACITRIGKCPIHRVTFLRGGIKRQQTSLHPRCGRKNQ